MLYYSLIFLLLALLAGILGCGVAAFAAAETAKICFFVFLDLFLPSCSETTEELTQSWNGQV